MAFKKTSVQPGGIAHDRVTFTGSVTIPSPFGKGKKIKAAIVSSAAATAANADKGLHISHALQSDGSLKIYAWKATAAGNTALAAATAAVTVNVTLFG